MTSPLDDATMDSLDRFSASVAASKIAALDADGTSLRHALLDDDRGIPVDALCGARAPKSAAASPTLWAA